MPNQIASTSILEQKPVGVLSGPASELDKQASTLYDESASKVKDLEKQRESDSSTADDQLKGQQGVMDNMQGVLDQQIDSSGQRQQDLHDFQLQQPKDQIGNVMRMSPLFLAMAAIGGGGLTKQNATYALGAMNGMVQGLMKGDRQQYDDANKQYQQNFQIMKERWALQDQVYNSMLKAYGNTLNAKQKAYEISLRAIGTDDKEIAEASKHMHEAMKIRADLVKQYDDNQEKLESARINAKSRVDAAGVHANAAGKASGASLDDYAKRMQAIANERKISLTSGSRSAAAISSQVAEMAKHGQELGYTPEEAIDHIRELQMKTGQENKESDVVAKREGVVKPAMKALTRDGGFFDQLNETAGKVNFGSAKWSNAFREWKAGKITDDPALRKYILVLEDTRADVQQVLSRTGGVTNKVREAADRMFPETSSVREMRAVIDQARKIVSNINDANEETLAELRGKVDSDASPEELAGAAKPSSSSGAKGDGWGEVVRH